MQSGIAYWLATLIAGGLNLTFNVVAARDLAPVAYGELAAIIALVNLFLLAIGALTRTVTAVVATLDEAEASHWLLRRGTAWLLPLGAAGFALVGLLAGPIGALLHLKDPLWIWIAAFALIPGYVGALNTGILQGLRLFRAAGGVNVVAAILKFAALLILLRVGLGVTGGALATVTEVTVVWLASLAVLSGRVLRGAGAQAPQARVDYRTLLALPVALTVARLLFFNVDILMARHYLGAHAAGLFAALGVTGRIIAYGTGALPPVLYPYLIRYREDRSLTARYLLLALGATAVAGGIATGAFYLAPGPGVHVLFGAAFAAIAPYVGWYALGFLFYSLSYIFLYYLLARENWMVWMYAVGGSLIEMAALAAFHANIAEFTIVVVVFFALLFLATGAHTAWEFSRPRAPQAPAGGSS